jgi:DNA-binding protein H-NS
MCTDEAVVYEAEDTNTVAPVIPETKAEPVTLGSLLKNESVAELLAAKRVVEGLLAERVNQEYSALRDNAAALAEATGCPVEQVLESLMPKTGRPARKLTVVEAPKPERVKYRHPENAELTWSGRGKQPGWLRDALQEYDEQDLLAA